MSAYLNALKNNTNVATTENGARAYATTKSAVLDFFAQGGALRQRSENEVISMFTKAFAEDSLLALKALFYFRDVRGGQGERQTFKRVIKYLANNHTHSVVRNIGLIPFYGRWDDLYELFGTKAESHAINVIRSQFFEDLESDSPSLLAKWLKSENASSYETKALATKTRKALGLTPRKYRKALSALRKQINIVESKMSSNEWNNISYDKLPSKAGLIYRNAFRKHDETGYQAFVDSLVKGEKTINTKTLFPYEIVHLIPFGSEYIDRHYYNGYKIPADADVINAMWNNLPDYFEGKEENSICVVDTSGSMTGLPMEVAISLGIYTAERNKGVFHNHFITFSNTPKLQELKGSNFCEKVQNLSRAEWAMSTNIEATMDLVLNTAVENNISQDEMVSRLYIISDMEFNQCTDRQYRNASLFKGIQKKFESKGYTMPEIVFWNVNARNTQFPMTMDERGVQFVSGASPSIFKNLLKGKSMSAYDLMLDVLNAERYSMVTI